MSKVERDRGRQFLTSASSFHIHEHAYISRPCTHTHAYTPPTHTHTVTDDPKNIPDLSPASSGVPGKCLSLAARGHVEHFLSRPVC